MNRLLIRPGAIGDCLLAFPALNHLKADYTEVWVPSAVMPLVQFADKVGSIAGSGIELLGVGDKETPAALHERLRSFHQIVSWYGYKRPEFRDALLRLNPQSVFYAALPDDGNAHAADFFARQVGAPEGLYPRLRLKPRAARDTIVIHPFSGGKTKNWPLDRFREVAERVRCDVEWIAGPEQELAGALRFESLLDLAEHMASARLYIGNDSGITHLAAATGVPTLALFGPTEPDVWGPRGSNVMLLREQPIGDLAVTTVLSAAQRLLYSSPT